MAKLIGFSQPDATRIASAVKTIEKRLVHAERQLAKQPPPEARIAIDGYLLDAMTRKTKKRMAVYAPDPEGALGAPTNEFYFVVDSGKIPTGVTLPIGTNVTAVWCNGVWLLIAYDCDLEAITTETAPEGEEGVLQAVWDEQEIETEVLVALEDEVEGTEQIG